MSAVQLDEDLIWDYCPEWCDQTEHSDGLSDRRRTEHSRRAGALGAFRGGVRAAYVTVVRESFHQLPHLSQNRGEDVCRLSLCNIPVEVFRENRQQTGAEFGLTASEARSLARILERAADIAEGVTR